MIVSIDTSELKKLRVRLDDGKKTVRRVYVCYADAAFAKLIKLIAGARIERVGAVIGPGAFSATRTGVALVNAVAYGLGVPVVGLSREQFDAAAPVPAGIKSPVAVRYGAPPNITKKKLS
jgi:tRNA A37 threonylcarbamoyladenosine modification protein TsaB